jgi:hypothetical protein
MSILFQAEVRLAIPFTSRRCPECLLSHAQLLFTPPDHIHTTVVTALIPETSFKGIVPIRSDFSRYPSLSYRRGGMQCRRRSVWLGVVAGLKRAEPASTRPSGCSGHL